MEKLLHYSRGSPLRDVKGVVVGTSMRRKLENERGKKVEHEMGTGAYIGAH